MLLDVSLYSVLAAVTTPAQPSLEILIKQTLAAVMAANIVKSWHSFSIKCLYFASQ